MTSFNDNPAPHPGMGQCQVTGRWVPQDELVTLNGTLVCAEGKQVLLERLRAGEATPGELERPTVSRRFCGIFIDLCILSFIVFVSAIAMGVSHVFISFNAAPTTDRTSAVITLVFQILLLVYFTLMHGLGGQTFGKMICKMKVVNANGSRITMMTAFLRAVYYTGLSLVGGIIGLMGVPGLQNSLASVIVAYGLANVIFALVDTSQQRALHDRFAGTRVIRV